MKFFVEHSTNPTDYTKLLDEKCLDRMHNKIKIGDKIAYSVVSRYAGSVSIGKIIELWLEYRGEWDFINKKECPDYNIIYSYVKIKGLLGGKLIIRRCIEVVKLI